MDAGFSVSLCKQYSGSQCGILEEGRCFKKWGPTFSEQYGSARVAVGSNHVRLWRKSARGSDLGSGQQRLQAGLKSLKGAPPQTHAVQRNAHLGCRVEADEAHAEVHRQAHQVALHDAGIGLALRDRTGWGGGETRQEDESEAAPPWRPTWIRSTSRNVAVWKAFSQISSSPSSSTLKNMSSPLSVWTLKQCFRLSRRSLSWKKTAWHQVQVNSAC